jgi:tetratricopeptide (TPR) repeat protein
MHFTLEAHMNSEIKAAIIGAAAVVLAALITIFGDDIRSFLRRFSKYTTGKRTFQKYEKLLRKELIALFGVFDSQQEYEIIVKVGPQINEYLWHKGFYTALIPLARIVEKAAGRLNRPDIQAKMLIEHIGWILACFGKQQQAIEEINTGIEIAKLYNNTFMQTKGLRHLAAIDYIYTHETNKAIEKLTEAKDTAERIEDANQRNEALAPICYGLAKVYLDKADLSKATEFNNLAEKYYSQSDNPQRATKLWAQKGEIEEKQGNRHKARALYNKGLILAQQNERRDDEIKNLRGLARVSTNDTDKQKYDQEATELEKTTQLLFY